MDSEIWKINTPYNERDAWIEFLLLANHKKASIITRRHECIEIKSGQFFTSIRKLAERFKWSLNRTRRYIETLEKAKMITVKRHTDGTLINIENYSKFQGTRNADGYTDEYADEYTDGTRTRSNKNDKKSIKTRARARTERFNNHSQRNEDMDALELALLKTN